MVQELANHDTLLLPANEIIETLGVIDHEVNLSEVLCGLIIFLMKCTLVFDDLYGCLIYHRVIDLFLCFRCEILALLERRRKQVWLLLRFEVALVEIST